MRTLMRLPGPRSPFPWLAKLGLVLVALLVAVVAYTAIFAVTGSLTKYPLSKDTPASQLRGAYHIHSSRSDGRADPQEIAKAAREAGLQFVIITDHNPDSALPPSYSDGVLIIHGAELSTPSGHLTALGLSRPVTDAEREKDPVGISRSLGALTFLSHPIQKKRPWTDWKAAENVTGLELYSADSMFRDAQRSPLTRFLPAVGAFLTRPVHGLMTVVGAQPETAEKLLELSARAPKVALCAHDAHGLPPYRSEFQTLSIYLPPSAGRQLPADPVAASKRVLDILGSGQSYCAFHGLAEGSGFSLRGVGEGRTARVGDTLEVVAPPTIPPESRVEVRGPGRLLPDGRSIRLEGPGVVQVEIWLLAPGRLFSSEWKPWIVPSPVLVLPRQ